MKFNFKHGFKFTKKRILAILEALFALVTFFTFFVPSIYFQSTVGAITYYNGFQAYFGGASSFSCTAAAVFYSIFTVVFMGLVLAKMFLNTKLHKLLTILAIVVATIALCFIVHAGTPFMLDTTLRMSGINGSGIHYFVGAYIQIGLTALWILFVSLDQWVIK